MFPIHSKLSLRVINLSWPATHVPCLSAESPMSLEPPQLQEGQWSSSPSLPILTFTTLSDIIALRLRPVPVNQKQTVSGASGSVVRSPAAAAPPGYLVGGHTFSPQPGPGNPELCRRESAICALWNPQGTWCVQKL